METFFLKLRSWNWPLILIIGTACFFRFFLLDLKAPHHDEGVNGSFADSITENGVYYYNPNNFHGPLHFYLLFLSKSLFGRNIWALRFPVAVIGVMCVRLILSLAPIIGQKAARLAAWFCAISPAMTFFGRSAIHETELVFFMLLACRGWLGVQAEGNRKSLWFLGLGVAGMILTKETSILHLTVFALAALSVHLWKKQTPYRFASVPQQTCRYGAKEVFLVIIASAALILFFYTGLFSRMDKGLDLFKSLNPWMNRSVSDKGHIKPFYYWLKLLTLYERPALVGLGLCVFAVLRKRPLPQPIRLLGIYAIGVLLVYSLMPYKTPWCIPSILWPFFLILGFFAIRFYEQRRQRFLFYATLLIFSLISTKTAAELNFVQFQDPKEPYVYVQTSRDICYLMDKLKKVQQADPTQPLRGKMLGSRLQPIPWLLQPYNIQYFERYAKPINTYDADFLLIELNRELDARLNLKNAYFTEFMTFWTDRQPLLLFLSKERFDLLFPGRTPEFQPSSKSGQRVDYAQIASDSLKTQAT